MKEKICGYYLDNNQEEIVLSNDKNLLVVAGAGSGKTFTIISKIYYLVNYRNIKEDEILCISFTNESSNNLKNKLLNDLNLNIDVFTFHKLSLNILNNNYSICDNELLDNIVHKFFNEDIFKDKKFYLKIKKYLKNNNISSLKKTIITFIHLFKCNNYELSDFNIFLNKIKYFNFNYKNEKLFLIIVLNIYLEYKKYLNENNEIDFDDMIIYATKKVKEEGFYKNIKYIIIDEYQDTSLIRFNLIKEIINKTNSNLLVVGDDYQSIYRFTGCDISLFIDFKKYFNDYKILKIENTYRNSQELIYVAGKFIMKNKYQIKKNLISNKHINKPIKIYYFKNKVDEFKKLILLFKDKELLVLGRNNNDIYDYIDNEFILKNDMYFYKDIMFKYLTVHKSKGLESDYVIILNLENKINGFPNKFVNEKILRLVYPKEKYLYAEERRLFYVALTRTKNDIYLITCSNESIFVLELLNNFKEYIEIKKMF